ncbi:MULTISPECIES: patatin-like phospholipase family protein [Asticcacaulis]|uniref:patatin-like phospholipase family protein n=1 Tax=Asticcacaulis TaxID=76890 RepID=UPI001AE3F496|nr:MULTISPECIES: patatin-like phospholipase family protein [Asticcacaulis]MBP2158711.1 NTE family protein [Asticcacaulis solisilvae]MDR6799757.1 NTE family protein [Asticcacaulis sp. BE141]
MNEIKTESSLQEALEGLFGTSLGEGASLISLPGGSRLFSAGDESDHLYLLRSGRLGVFRHDEDVDEQSLIGIIRPGEPVGEMSLIAGTYHTSSVIALRDSDLLAMPREDFLKAIDSRPELLLALSRKIIDRVRRTIPNVTPNVFAFFGLCEASILPMVERVATQVRALGYKVAVLDKGFHGTTPEAFSRIEAENDFVLHVAEKHESHWRLLSARQVDHVFLVADAETKPDLWQTEGEKSMLHRAPDLLLFYPEGVAKAQVPGRTNAWLHAIKPNRWFHIHPHDVADVARLARIITGHSVGIVFSGGGARAFAQIGAIQALREAHIPVDFVCGSSMGAILSACLAMQWDDDEIERRMRDAFVDSSPLDDIAFPFIAMTSGKKVDERLEKHFGEIMIEDMPLPYFCLSSNLTSGTLKVHKTGRLRDALRASISLPGVLPPVVQDNEVLVDGAVMRSFPATMMRNTHLGTVIGVDVTRARGVDPRALSVPKKLTSWFARGDWRRGPPIVSVMMRSATITTAADLAQSRAATDLLIIPEPEGVEIRDWKAYDKAVENGYQTTVHALSQLDCPVTTLRKMGRSIHPNVPAFTPDDSFAQAVAQIPEKPPERQKTIKPASKADRKPRPKAGKPTEP